MGVHLSTPKTEKYSQDGEGGGVRYGLASMQGWRTTMEDAVSFSPLRSPPPLSRFPLGCVAGASAAGCGCDCDATAWSLCRVRLCRVDLPDEFAGDRVAVSCLLW
jgi:protein phosphatase 1G